MEHWICVTCGVQFAAGQARPQACPICSDERQYIGYQGQQWTTLALMKAEGYHNKIKEHEPQVIGIGTNPSFAIGQRALLVQTGKGNVLWDCISYLDDATVEEVKRLGGVHAIAISHPHFYGSMVEFAQCFDAPIYLPEADRQWVMRPDSRIKFWSGETMRLLDAVTLVRLGGHFSGSTVLHWADGAKGNGLLLTGDTIQVVADRNWVSFMYSFPNIIPLPAAEVARIRDTIASYSFERLYGGWFDRIVAADARNVVIRSADRYIRALEEQH